MNGSSNGSISPTANGAAHGRSRSQSAFGGLEGGIGGSPGISNGLHLDKGGFDKGTRVNTRIQFEPGRGRTPGERRPRCPTADCSASNRRRPRRARVRARSAWRARTASGISRASTRRMLSDARGRRRMVLRLTRLRPTTLYLGAIPTAHPTALSRTTTSCGPPSGTSLGIQTRRAAGRVTERVIADERDERDEPEG